MGINEGPSFELYMKRVQNIMDTAASVDKPEDRRPSREVVARAYALDAYVSLAGCDREHARHSLLDMLYQEFEMITDSLYRKVRWKTRKPQIEQLISQRSSEDQE